LVDALFGVAFLAAAEESPPACCWAWGEELDGPGRVGSKDEEEMARGGKGVELVEQAVAS